MRPSQPHIQVQHTVVKRATQQIFYGWWIVAACVVNLALISGIGVYGLGVFLPSLEQAFKLGPTLISLGGTIFFLVSGLAGPYVGRSIDLLGPRRVMVVGCIVFGIGLVGLALAQQLWQTYVTYAVIAVGFTSTALLPVSALVSAWFAARRGLAMSLAMIGLSLGGVVMVPLATHLILTYGWRLTAVALAVLVWFIGIPLAACVIRRRPADLGLLPDGAPHSQPGPSGHSALQGPIWSLAAARRTRAFWAIAIGYLLVYLGQTGVIFHQIRFLTYGTAAQGALSPQSAAIAVSVTALASIAGRLAFGAIIDRLNKRWVAISLIGIQAIATVGLLLARGNLLLVYSTVLTFGLVMGCVLMLHALLISDLFGVASFGAIYGATLSVTTFGTAGGPWVASLLFDRFGNYDAAFSLFAGLGLLAAAIVGLAGPPATASESAREVAQPS